MPGSCPRFLSSPYAFAFIQIVPKPDRFAVVPSAALATTSMIRSSSLMGEARAIADLDTRILMVFIRRSEPIRNIPLARVNLRSSRLDIASSLLWNVPSASPAARVAIGLTLLGALINIQRMSVEAPADT